MDTKNIIILVVLIVSSTLLVGAFFHGSKLNDETILLLPSNSEPDQVRIITAKHQTKQLQEEHKDRVSHIIVGEIELPTPCHLLETSSRIRDEKVDILFRVTSNSDVCVQVITPARFRVDFEAKESVEIVALYNGKPARFNLIDASPDENLDEFEIFIKG